MDGFLFYQFDEKITTVEYSKINIRLVTEGYVTKSNCKILNIDAEIKSGSTVDLFDRQIILRAFDVILKK